MVSLLLCFRKFLPLPPPRSLYPTSCQSHSCSFPSTPPSSSRSMTESRYLLCCYRRPKNHPHSREGRFRGRFCCPSLLAPLPPPSIAGRRRRHKLVQTVHYYSGLTDWSRVLWNEEQPHRRRGRRRGGGDLMIHSLDALGQVARLPPPRNQKHHREEGREGQEIMMWGFRRN